MHLTPDQYPERVSTALSLAHHLRQPKRIAVWTNKGKYPEITNYDFGDTEG